MENCLKNLQSCVDLVSLRLLPSAFSSLYGTFLENNVSVSKRDRLNTLFKRIFLLKRVFLVKYIKLHV